MLIFGYTVLIIPCGGGFIGGIVSRIVIAPAAYVLGKLPCGKGLYRLWIFPKGKAPEIKAFLGELRDTLPLVSAPVPLLAAAVCFAFSFPAAGFGAIDLTGNRKIGRAADLAGLAGKQSGGSG
ncbi:hypothetical protein T258_704 [Clostridium sporogenes]|nr:hypothetical protein T258_704 [Clostridium botulinum Prevot_594]